MTTDHDYSDFTNDLKPGQNLMSRIEGLAQEQLDVEALLASLEEQLVEAKAALKDVKEKRLPELLEEAGLGESTIKTPSGIEVKVATTIRGSIPASNPMPAFAWLEDHNHGRLIKRQITIEFGKGDDKWADKFERDCAQRKKPLNLKRKKTVHASTLCSFVKGQLEEGVSFPMEIFGVYRQRVSKIKLPKEGS